MSRVLLVDKHPLLRVGARAVLEPQADLEVVGEAESTEAAVRVARERSPDLILIDPSLVPLPRGTKPGIQRFAQARLLVLSAHADVAFVRSMMIAGVAGFVSKRAHGDELLRALRMVARGETYLEPGLAGALRLRPGHAVGAQLPLSEREDQVLRLVALGHSTKEISVALNLSPRTLETYRARAMNKLKLRSRAGLIRFAWRSGWLADV